MLIRLLCAHEMTKHVCKISLLNSKHLLRKLQKMLGGYFILPHPVYAVCCRTTEFSMVAHVGSCMYLWVSDASHQKRAEFQCSPFWGFTCIYVHTL